jgi:CheY-like chemotaxis protein
VAKQHSILIVEDDADLRTTLSSLLAQEGYAVQTASDGQDALDLFDQGYRPTLAVIDLVLPRMSGWELLTQMRRVPELQGIRSVVLTGVPSHDVDVIANVVFQKPLDSAKLLRTVSALADT